MFRCIESWLCRISSKFTNSHFCSVRDLLKRIGSSCYHAWWQFPIVLQAHSLTFELAINLGLWNCSQSLIHHQYSVRYDFSVDVIAAVAQSSAFHPKKTWPQGKLCCPRATGEQPRGKPLGVLQGTPSTSCTLGITTKWGFLQLFPWANSERLGTFLRKIEQKLVTGCILHTKKCLMAYQSYPSSVRIQVFSVRMVITSTFNTCGSESQKHPNKIYMHK